jgi:hypothetical protein
MAFGPWWTEDRGTVVAHQSTGSRMIQTMGGRREWRERRGERDDANGMLTGTRKVAMQWHIRGEASAPNGNGTISGASETQKAAECCEDAGAFLL